MEVFSESFDPIEPELEQSVQEFVPNKRRESFNV